MGELIAFINARLLLPTCEVTDGSLVIEDGCIRTVCPESIPPSAKTVDLEGNILMPGLVDLHSDAIEHEVQPRHRTFLPFDLAVRQADRLFATVGVSTAFHSLSFLSDKESHRNNTFTADFCRAIAKHRGRAIIDNRVHARFEMTNAQGLAPITQLIQEGIVGLASVMDHTPGQGQYADEDAFRAYCRGVGMSEEKIDQTLAEKKAASLAAGPDVEALAETVRKYGIPFASHDDDLPERFVDHVRRGITIAEFPMNLPSARAAISAGFCVLVGSPNVVRGVSTGNGPRAMDLFEQGGANALCSDYMPATLLPAIFKIADDLGWPLWRAALAGTKTPAEAAKLFDRGAIIEGMRADLIEVEPHHAWPIVRKLFLAGQATYTSTPAFA